MAEKEEQSEDQRAWMLLAVTGTRTYQGNEGYADELEKFYKYDSNVGNHRQLSEGDFIVLRQNSAIIAAAMIKTIEDVPSTKAKNYCPHCGSARVLQRKKMKPQYSCSDCRGEFETPKRETKKVTAYTAWYEGFLRSQKPLPDAIFRPAWIQMSDQMSIRGLYPSKLAQILTKHWPAAEELLSLSSSIATIGPEEGAVEEPPPEDGYKPTGTDERRKVMKQIRERRGQQGFRKKLLRAYKKRCVFSGCSLVDLLEAAHIDAYRGEAYHHPSNGLLLRADLHTLFDLNLLAVEPETLRLFLAPAARGVGYDHLDGLKLDIQMIKGVSTEALARRWKAFRP